MAAVPSLDRCAHGGVGTGPVLVSMVEKAIVPPIALAETFAWGRTPTGGMD
jgi:hypothetical protein